MGCQSMSSQMHEVGHSIGLHHSGEYEGSDSVQEYGDQTDLMGFSYRSDDTPLMCFNPAKNWQLGWFDDKVKELDPSNDIGIEPTSFVLNGIVDYKTITDNANVVLKIGNFYIGFNKATDFNIGVQEAGNQVTVTEKLGQPDTSTKSKIAAKLSIGGQYLIEITPLLSVLVRYVKNDNFKDAVIELNIAGDAIECAGDYDAEIVVELKTDNYPAETSYGIADATGKFVFYKEGLTQRGTYTDAVTGLCRGLEYYFVIEDKYGDGICCSWGEGSFIGKFGDIILFSGGQFSDQQTIPFKIPLDLTKSPTRTPTAKPTRMPTVEPTAEPTAEPTSAPVESTMAPTMEPTAPPVDPGGCVDDPGFLYRNKEGKDCPWVKKKGEGRKERRRTKILCLRKASEDTNDKVWKHCRKICSDAGVNKAKLMYGC